MERNKQTDGTVTWVVQFQVFERPSRLSAWALLTDLRVELDTRHAGIATAVAERGLSDEQAARAMGPAADDARAFSLGELTQREALDSVRDVFR